MRYVYGNLSDGMLRQYVGPSNIIIRHQTHRREGFLILSERQDLHLWIGLLLSGLLLRFIIQGSGAL